MHLTVQWYSKESERKNQRSKAKVSTFDSLAHLINDKKEKSFDDERLIQSYLESMLVVVFAHCALHWDITENRFHVFWDFDLLVDVDCDMLWLVDCVLVIELDIHHVYWEHHRDELGSIVNRFIRWKDKRSEEYRALLTALWFRKVRRAGSSVILVIRLKSDLKKKPIESMAIVNDFIELIGYDSWQMCM